MIRNSIKWMGFAALLCGPVTVSFAQQQPNFLSYVDTRIGNVGQLLEPTRPTVQLPNQVMRMYPIRANYIDDQISSFPLLVVSHRQGEAFSLKPVVGEVSPESFRKRMTYDHDLEVLKPWQYETFLVDDDITVGFTPGEKSGIYQVKFPKGKPHYLLLDDYNGGKNSWSLNGSELNGHTIFHGDVNIYVYGVFNAKPASQEALNKNRLAVKFDADVVELRYAVSFISAEQAKQNYQQELGNGITPAALAKRGEAAWAKVINQVQVKGGTEAQKRSFYSALYRCYERMVNITENGRYYSGYDKQVHTSDRPFYVDDWSWDTYLAHHPLRTILHPAQEEDMLNSYVLMYEQSGWVPTFPLVYGDHACMNGFHPTITFLDAHRKGLKRFNLEKAYEGSLKNADEATMAPWKNGPKGPLDDFYHKNGYFPALAKGEEETDKIIHSWEKRQAVAVTLGGAYDDWAVGQLATTLGKKADADRFAKRALNYKNLYNPKYKMFIPKDSKGNWVEIDPKWDGGMGARDYYDENNGYTFQWQVQHDIPGLRDLMGGAAAMEANLDQLFREGLGRSKYEFWSKLPDATGNVGQFSMGNEPSFHIPYLYNYTGSAWKTQKRIRFLLDVWYKDNIFGIPGDEDGGGMTAFVVFSSLGFYPVTPGEPVYTIGSPLFEESAIKLENGKTFKVIAKNSSVVNKYIQRARFNGKVLDKPFFTHDQLMNGGVLELEMGAKPNKDWGK
ncbi:GH92 family glycosyl hydrolase [Chitinophaga horti]|uniref:GH92 family glycosyl hydrolase n=1 Tax=Chitinophaga horti TaxID=2920382 RepID=A0ABY6IV80_9BACT|nr:GH92 family glycosyl hydrolase [Chitinophaga horti]UYQ91275.1 GH92 family glycosyl hydrolase [Chitinophaga horti]